MAPAGFQISTDVCDAIRFISRFYVPLSMGAPYGMTLTRRGEAIGAVLYNGFTGGNVWMQGAGTPGKPWLTRAGLKWMFHYPFHQMKVERISTWVEEDNEPSIKFTEHLGFVREHVLPRAGRHGQAAFIYRMFREDCRYA